MINPILDERKLSKSRERTDLENWIDNASPALLLIIYWMKLEQSDYFSIW